MCTQQSSQTLSRYDANTTFSEFMRSRSGKLSSCYKYIIIKQCMKRAESSVYMNNYVVSQGTCHNGKCD